MLDNREFEDDIMDEFAEFRKTHAVEWGGNLLQPIERQVEGLIMCVIRSVEKETQGLDDNQISTREATFWAKTCLGANPY